MHRISYVIALSVGLIGGCGFWPSHGSARYTTPERMDSGLVILLPGIEGESPFNYDIRQGLAAGGVPDAIRITNWGMPIPAVGPLINQVNVPGNRSDGEAVARLIVRYQDEHPGKPVFLVGHSGGGGIAVFAAEALPDGRKVDGLVLLSPSVSSDYDLTKALAKTRCGIVNFYSMADAGLLIVGTTIAGNVDGSHGAAAGAVGFYNPTDTRAQTQPSAYDRLFQVNQGGDIGKVATAHFAATRVDYVAAYVAPWIITEDWPAIDIDGVRQGAINTPAKGLASKGPKR